MVSEVQVDEEHAFKDMMSQVRRERRLLHVAVIYEKSWQIFEMQNSAYVRKKNPYMVTSEKYSLNYFASTYSQLHLSEN